MTTISVGRYELEKQLGVGGMAVVYRALDPFMKRRVAVKVLTYELTTEKLYQTHFQREAELIAALEHPAIVPVYDFGRHGTQPYIVMRFMVGGTLEERLAEGGIVEVSELSRITSRIAAGLDAAHKRDIVHLDVKPSNVLFDAEDEAHLADFGIAKILHRSSGDTGRIALGTPQYMSPEQVTGGKLDGRCDVYALGVLLYRALAGRPPFSGPSSAAIGKAHLSQPVPDIRQYRPDLRTPWTEIIQRAMAKDPVKRFPSAGDLAYEVQELAAGRWYMRKLNFD
jgi:serine/threonine-protein kinase